MRAHDAVNVVVIVSEPIQETGCKSSLSIVFMYHELSNPTYSLTIVCPAASEHVTDEAPVHGDFPVRACGVVG